MNLLVRFFGLFASEFPLGHIYNHVDGELYMERFALCSFFGGRFAMRLHHIVREDRDRHCHDHPWDFFSLVLQNSYVEARPLLQEGLWDGPDNGDETALQEKCTFTRRGFLSLGFRRALDRHKIVAVEPDTWTLFITGPYKNQWGFYTPEGKVPYRLYLGLPPRDHV